MASLISLYIKRHVLRTRSSSAARISNENLNIKRRSYEEVCKGFSRCHIPAWAGYSRQSAEWDGDCSNSALRVCGRRKETPRRHVQRDSFVGGKIRRT